MKIGIIGFGHLAHTMAKGLLKNGFNSEEIIIYDTNKEVEKNALLELGLVSAHTNKELVRDADLVILSVKPGQYKEVLDEIKDELKDKVLVSCMAARRISLLEEALNPGAKIGRAMPSIAMEVGQSLTAVSFNDKLNDEEKKAVLDIFSRLGTSRLMDEDDLDRLSVVSGSGIGYVAQIIDLMADAAASIGYGSSKDQVEKDMVMIFKGCISILESSGLSASQMADAVATEGGTTIEGINLINEKGVGEIFSQAFGASYKKIEKLQN